MLIVAVLSACVHSAPPEVPLPPLAERVPAQPRSVILMIGDGMGPQQLGLLEAYAHSVPSSPYAGTSTAFQRLAEAGTVGLSLHSPADGLVTDSACSATQLALGEPSLNGLIGLDADGVAQTNLRERAVASGWATGIVSDTRLTHATPASFLAHVSSRRRENDIAAQIVASDVDVALSGGRRFFVAEGGRREDGRDLLAEGAEAGFDVVTDAAGLAAAGPRVLGLFADGALPNAIQAPEAADVPSLADLTEAALARLEDDPDGFFLMVEGGQIDWAAHSNDAGWMLAELQRFDAAVDVALAYAEAHPDTLLVVTADHETGGFGLSPSAKMPLETAQLDPTNFPDGYTPVESPLAVSALEQLARQPYPAGGLLKGYGEGLDAAELVRRVEEDWGYELGAAEAERILSDHPMTELLGHFPEGKDGAIFALPRVLADQTGAVWATSGHTHTPVPVLSMGPGSERFGGLLHHVEVGRRLGALVSAPMAAPDSP